VIPPGWVRVDGARVGSLQLFELERTADGRRTARWTTLDAAVSDAQALDRRSPARPQGGDERPVTGSRVARRG